MHLAFFGAICLFSGLIWPFLLVTTWQPWRTQAKLVLSLLCEFNNSWGLRRFNSNAVKYVAVLWFHHRSCGSRDCWKRGTKQYCTSQGAQQKLQKKQKRKHSEGNSSSHWTKASGGQQPWLIHYTGDIYNQIKMHTGQYAGSVPSDHHGTTVSQVQALVKTVKTLWFHGVAGHINVWTLQILINDGFYVFVISGL